MEEFPSPFPATTIQFWIAPHFAIVMITRTNSECEVSAYKAMQIKTLNTYLSSGSNFQFLTYLNALLYYLLALSGVLNRVSLLCSVVSTISC